MFASLLRLLRLSLLLLLLVAVIVFTVSNREDVNLSLFPLPYEISLPLYLFFLLTLAVGYGWGVLSTAITTLRHKRVAKKELARVDALKQEVSALRAQANSSAAASGSTPNSPPQLDHD